MINNINRKNKGVFYLKLKLSNIVCSILVSSIVGIAVLALMTYHTLVYLHQLMPYWEILGIVLLTGILLHFFLVAIKGLITGVRGH